MELYCKNCQYLENYGIGMTEGPQWFCHSPSLAIYKANWRTTWTTHRGFWFWHKPFWRNRHNNCPDYKEKKKSMRILRKEQEDD